MQAAITPATRAVLICTPNNPTGPVVAHRELTSLLDAIPDHILVVVDEAYIEFVADPTAARGLELVQDRPNVAVLRTFSKAYGLAGFRVGYCVAEPSLAAAVRAAALPFGVSGPAQAAAVASLAATSELLERVHTLVAARTCLAEGLTSLGFDLPAAQGNFVWLPAGAATDAYAQQFAEAGIMVRPYAAGDPGDGIRITVGDAAANAAVLEVADTLPR
jgi:histidinol-phosphate aminotransferase